MGLPKIEKCPTCGAAVRKIWINGGTNNYPKLVEPDPVEVVPLHGGDKGYGADWHVFVDENFKGHWEKARRPGGLYDGVDVVMAYKPHAKRERRENLRKNSIAAEGTGND